MPQIPTVSNFSNGLNTTSTTSIVNAPDASASIAAKQTQELGGAISNFGQVQTAIEIDKATMANQLRVDDAMNQAKAESMRLAYDPKEGYTSLKGVNALERPDGKPLAEEYGERLRKRMSELEESLGNDAQRRAFQMNSNDLYTQFHGQVLQHEGAEFKTYAASVREGTIKNRQQEIAINWDKPEIVDQAVNSIKAATYDLARTQLGKSAEEAEALTRDAVSSAHKLAISTALEKGNVTYANDYFQKYSKDNQMNANDILSVNGILNTQMDATLAVGAVTKTTEKYMGAFQPSDMDRLTNIVLGQESGNRDYAPDGTVLTSPKGAKGKMQVMDATNKDPGYGVNPAKDDSLEERARVGRDYLKAMVSRYGDVTKGLAAYNGGPDAVDKAIAKATAAGNPGGWLALMPKESQDYATNGTRKFQAGSGKTEMPTQYEYVQDAVARLGENPRMETLKATRDAATAQYKLITESVKQKGEQAVANAIRELRTNGGDFTALPPSIRSEIPPDKIDEVRKAGTNQITDAVVYNDLSANPQKVTAMTDDQFVALRSQLSETDWKHFAEQRSGAGTNAPTNLNYASINNVLNNRLESIGIDSTPKGGTGKAEKVAAIRQVIATAVQDEQRVKGRALTDTETTQVIDRVFSLRSSTGWSTSTPVIKRGVAAIPSETEAAIKAQLKKMGKPDPTDSDVFQFYMRGLTQTQNKAKNNG